MEIHAGFIAPASFIAGTLRHTILSRPCNALTLQSPSYLGEFSKLSFRSLSSSPRLDSSVHTSVGVGVV